ncbi:MAG: Holliday junction branch migration protein RuvA [Spirochaetia bacterium]
MIYSITGTITYKTSSVIRLFLAGIEWEIHVSPGTAFSAPEPGREHKLFIYLNHKEDSMQLFGFGKENERSVFLQLLKVSGIGPKQAQKILAGTSPEKLIQEIEAADVSSLSRIPGIGKKTAQKIILSLQNILPKTEGSQTFKEQYADLIEGLCQMGYEKKKAEKAVEAAASQGSSEPGASMNEEALFRQAIINLSTES